MTRLGVLLGLLTLAAAPAAAQDEQSFSRIYVTTSANVQGTLTFGASADTILQAGASADILELYRSTNPQRFNVFNTRTSGSNCEYGYTWWNSNIFRLGTTKCSSGTDRNIVIEPGGSTALTLAAT